MTEAELLQNVRDLARWAGWLTYHTHDSRRSEAGFPDLVMTKNRRLLFVELKSETGRMSKDQLRWYGALLEAGCTAHVWRPADWDSGLIERILTG